MSKKAGRKFNQTKMKKNSKTDKLIKNVKITIQGNSKLAYVSFYDAQLIKRLNELDASNFDFIDFRSENQKKEIFLGRGFCMSNEPIIKVFCNDNEIYDGAIYYNNSPSSYTQDQVKQEFYDENGIEYNKAISGEDRIGADEQFFSDANNYKYCSLEIVECYTSVSTVKIGCKDNFNLSDFKVKFIKVDTGEEGSITDVIWNETGLEDQVYGIEYQGKFYEFEGGEDEGGQNDIVWLEYTDGEWNASNEISLIISEFQGL
jgi:hypothetical protein